MICSAASGLLWSSGGAGVENSGLDPLEPAKDGLEEPEALVLRLVELLPGWAGCNV